MAIATALWIATMLASAVCLISYGVGYPLLDPVVTVIFFLLGQEAARTIAAMHQQENDELDGE